MARTQDAPTVCSSSTRGTRPDNQDHDFVGRSTVLGGPATILAVADGMGGLEGGGWAARIAIDAVREFSDEVLPKQTSRQGLRSSVVELFQEANRRIRAWSQGQEFAGDSGTTLVLCLVAGEHYLVAATGDSRCYYVNDWEARQLTTDHTRVQELIERGSMTPQSAAQSPYRHQLTNCLGEAGEIRVDLFPPTPHLAVIDEPCVLLLCSDGLHSATHAHGIFEELQGTRDLETGCHNLVSWAYENGSTDNITVAAAEVRPLARKGARRARRPSVEELGSRLEPGEAMASPLPTVPRRSSSWRRMVGLVAMLTGGLLLVTLWLWGDPMFELGLSR